MIEGAARATLFETGSPPDLSSVLTVNLTTGNVYVGDNFGVLVVTDRLIDHPSELLSRR